MLQELHIKNFGVIESMQLDFQPGFLAISGETGAGKSILLQAIAFVMGERADSDLIRTGAEEGSVLMVISAPKDQRVQTICEQIGVSYPSDGEFILRRSLHLSGKSRAHINDEPVTLKSLQSFTLATIHLVRQHASQQLFEEEFLLDQIDQYGGLKKLRESYQESFQLFREASRTLLELTTRVQNTRQQEEFLRYQFEELNRANLRIGEEEELEEVKQRLKNRVAITTASYEISETLSESDQSISNQLGKLLHTAEKTAHWDHSFHPIFLKLQETSQSLDEISREVIAYQQKLEGNPEELEQIEERLALISELKRKYRTDESGLVNLLEELQLKVGEI